MRTLAVSGLTLLLACGAFAQHHSGAIGNSIGTNAGFGNVVFPAGKPTQGAPFTLNGNLNHGFVGHPVVNGAIRHNSSSGGVVYVPYAYPVYSGGGYYNGYGYGDVPPQQPPPNVTVVYPP